MITAHHHGGRIFIPSLSILFRIFILFLPPLVGCLASSTLRRPPASLLRKGGHQEAYLDARPIILYDPFSLTLFPSSTSHLFVLEAS